jgi:nucleotide-binding universal stress UspA family protein
MAYKTILLVLNEVERALQLIETARSLAVKFGAHISGLYVIPGVMAYPSDGLSMGAGLGVGSFDGHRKHFMDRLRNVRGEFETAMRSDDLSFDFHVVDSDIPVISTSVIENCRTSDLIIVSAIDRENTSSVESDFVEQVVLAAGRPVLVLPIKGESKIEFNNIILAWNASKESARAAFDGLDFMRAAKATRIITVDKLPETKSFAMDIAESLDRHGVDCELTELSSSGRSVGETLLSAMKDYEADLLILGAYGHNRLTEWVFGGTTRHILRNLNCPILMSH